MSCACEVFKTVAVAEDVVAWEVFAIWPVCIWQEVSSLISDLMNPLEDGASDSVEFPLPPEAIEAAAAAAAAEIADVDTGTNLSPITGIEKNKQT